MKKSLLDGYLAFQLADAFLDFFLPLSSGSVTSVFDVRLFYQLAYTFVTFVSFSFVKNLSYNTHVCFLNTVSNIF